MRKWFVLSVAVFGFFSALAVPISLLPSLHAVEAAVVDAGNKFCPLSGDKVSGKSFVEHGGKRYGLCCPMCERKFLADPEKYIAEMNAQEAGEATEPREHMH